jgi:hypothetical protein
MKNVSMLFFAVIVVFVAALTLTTSGCKKDESTAPQIQPITDDLFPLTVGRQLVFSGVLRDAVTDQEIASTGAVYEGRMTIVSNASAVPTGGTSTLLLDSSKVPTGLANPPTVWRTTGFYIARTSPTGTGNFNFLTNIGRFYRSFGVQRPDSLRWVMLVRQDMGVGTEWTAFDSSWTAPTGVVRLQIVGIVEKTESITVGGSTFNTYKVVATRKIYLGSATTPSVVGTTATIWLAPNIGIVKFWYNSDGETPGFSRDYKSRNF